MPAHFAGAIRRWDYIHCTEPGTHQQRLEAKLEQAKNDAEPHTMLRFDCCAGIDTKLQLSEGNAAWGPQLQRLYAGDPRAFDIIFEFPREHIPIWKRPSIQATIIDGYPVEYRVFVSDGQIQGLSNYYPQRPLPRDDEQIAAVMRLTQQLIDHCQTPFLWNRGFLWEIFSEQYDTDGVHFTADFIVDHNGQVLFLEGGPPHELGAHPSCFPIGHISGVALVAHDVHRG